MSFASDAKIEVLKEEIASDCCAIAFLSALVKCSGQLGFGLNKTIIVEVYTELLDVYEIIKRNIMKFLSQKNSRSICDFAITRGAKCSSFDFSEKI